MKRASCEFFPSPQKSTHCPSTKSNGPVPARHATHFPVHKVRPATQLKQSPSNGPEQLRQLAAQARQILVPSLQTTLSDTPPHIDLFLLSSIATYRPHSRCSSTRSLGTQRSPNYRPGILLSSRSDPPRRQSNSASLSRLCRSRDSKPPLHFPQYQPRRKQGKFDLAGTCQGDMWCMFPAEPEQVAQTAEQATQAPAEAKVAAGQLGFLYI